jgi:sodium/proline symporter
VVGALTVIVWKQFGWLGLYEIIPGFFFSAIAIVVFSLTGPKPSAGMVKRFERADQEHAAA